MKTSLIFLNTIADMVLMEYNKINENPIMQLGINRLTGLILKISKMTSIEGSIIPKKSRYSWYSLFLVLVSTPFSNSLLFKVDFIVYIL